MRSLPFLIMHGTDHGESFVEHASCFDHQPAHGGWASRCVTTDAPLGDGARGE